MLNSVTKILKPRELWGLRIIAVMTGCALPIQIMGRASIVVPLIVATLGFLTLPDKDWYFKRVSEAARGPFGVMLLITFLLWLPGVYYSVSPALTLMTLVRPFIFMGIVSLLWAVLVVNKFLADLALRTMVLASLGAVIIAIIIDTSLPELYWLLHFEGWRSYPIGGALKPFSSLAVLIIPVLFWASSRLSTAWRLLSIASIIGFVMIVWFTYNRATIAGLLVSMVVFAAWWAWTSRYWMIKVAFPIACIAVIVAVILWLIQTRPQAEYEGHWLFPPWLIDLERQVIWNFAYEIFQQNFWLGMGANTINFAPGANDIIPFRNSDLHMIPSHPHNWVLEIAAETGVLGLMSLLVMIGYTVLQHFKSLILHDNVPYLAAICVAIGYWSSGLFNFSFWSAWWQMSFLLIMALVLSFGHQRKFHPD